MRTHNSRSSADLEKQISDLEKLNEKFKRQEVRHIMQTFIQERANNILRKENGRLLEAMAVRPMTTLRYRPVPIIVRPQHVEHY